MWHAIIAFGQHKGSNDVGRGKPSSPLGRKNDRTTSGVTCYYRHWTSSHSRTASGVACHHRPWTENAVKQCWAWHAIIAFGQHTRKNDVRRGMPPSPLGSTNGQTTSGEACYHRPWTTRTVVRRRAWHDITTHGRHTRSNDVGCGMTSSPLDCTHSRTTSGMA